VKLQTDYNKQAELMLMLMLMLMEEERKYKERISNHPASL